MHNNNFSRSEVIEYLENTYKVKILDFDYRIKTTRTSPPIPTGGETTVVFQFNDDQIAIINAKLQGTTLQNMAINANMMAKFNRLIPPWITEGNIIISSSDTLTVTMDTLREIELLLALILN